MLHSLKGGNYRGAEFLEKVHVCIHNKLYFTDPTLTHANISTVTATVPLKGDALGHWVLGVPMNKCTEIYQQSSTATQERKWLIDYYLNYSPYASWSDLVCRLYRKQYHNALSAAKRFIKKELGKFM